MPEKKCCNRFCYMRNRITHECIVYTEPWDTLDCDVRDEFDKQYPMHKGDRCPKD